MLRKKVSVTTEVDAIEVDGIVFTQNVLEQTQYTNGDLHLVDRDNFWVLGFPGGAFKGSSPDECMAAFKAMIESAVKLLEKK